MSTYTVKIQMHNIGYYGKSRCTIFAIHLDKHCVQIHNKNYTFRFTKIYQKDNGGSSKFQDSNHALLPQCKCHSTFLLLFKKFYVPVRTSHFTPTNTKHSLCTNRQDFNSSPTSFPIIKNSARILISIKKNELSKQCFKHENATQVQSRHKRNRDNRILYPSTQQRSLQHFQNVLHVNSSRSEEGRMLTPILQTLFVVGWLKRNQSLCWSPPTGLLSTHLASLSMLIITNGTFGA